MYDPDPKTVQLVIRTKAEARDRRWRDVRLAVMVPLHARDNVQRRAFEQGATIRAIILRALVTTGVTRLDRAALVDRRF
jgi:hypothetical protein